MDIGLGLPISNPRSLIEWSHRAEACGFSTLGLLDRLVFDNPEPLVALSVLAGTTERIRLQTEVLLGPLRSTALLAKQVSTLDSMSGGRFRLGIGVGGRDDDHAAAGTPVHRRGAMMDDQLRDLRRIWSGEPYRADGAASAGGVVGPAPTSARGPEILIGAFAPKALRRVAQHGDGFLCATPLERVAAQVATVREQWTAAGRAGSPRLVCQVNVAVGPENTVETARAAIADYYAFTGRQGWGAPVSDPQHLRDLVDSYRELGADELMLYCYADDPDQIERVAALAL
ncbi:LLM class flavin-dependent oxidoreductase [Rhodococcus sp. D2-41]|uniref:LLM class flavin-dependent oxidoreductase n=1 Tax=Speluncibacter jeojiensis TaxID=2710754 RepID=UPI00240FDE2C|nr:LLM class flavin-dependent oxidoreductase [Rhodococcus sp. D2-41]MDG3010140.1 LLM class flavin-dependent oxidoreductase [Rhodococcus sp. D2-41]